MTQQIYQSPLRTALNFVAKEELKGRVTKDALLNLCECYLQNPLCTRLDIVEFGKTIAKYRLTKFVDKYKPHSCRQLINAERALPYKYKCGVCGRKISNTDSVERGVGPVCYAKLQAGLSQVADKVNAVIRRDQLGVHLP